MVILLIGCLDITSLSVNLNQLLVILNDGLIWLWVVVDAPIADQVRQIGVLDLVANTRCIFEVLLDVGREEDLQ